MDVPSLILKGLLFGIALAMDAFSVSLANGLHDTKMRPGRALTIAGVFSFFQAAMPLIGWLCIRTALEYFTAFELAIPYIALVLLCLIGGKMIYDSLKEESSKEALAAGETADSDTNREEPVCLTFSALILQGIATSIDALSVGFDIAEHTVIEALIEASVIAVATFFICLVGVYLGKKFGTKLSGSAELLGGAILIAIGFEIFISSFFK